MGPSDKCVTCRMFEVLGGDSGRCHRVPPVPVITHNSVSWEQPRVMKTDWCGEYLHKPSPTD